MRTYTLPVAADVPETIILADGDFPTHPLALEWLKNCPYVVCCDGAANACIRWGRLPEAIVGDGDSLEPDLRRRYARLVHREAEQETNDLSKAFRFCLERGRRNITFLGATGKREDHTLGNISLLVDYMDQAEVQMMTDYGLFQPIDRDAMFQSLPGQQVSFFNMGATELSALGLVYPLSPFTNWWQGTLNEVESTRFFVHTNGKVLVFRVHAATAGTGNCLPGLSGNPSME